MSVVIPVILCGGSGTRLWPLSRKDRPKQLISLLDGETLLDGTLKRVKSIDDALEPICVVGAVYAAHVRQTLQRLGLKGSLILEPVGRNTAPALTAAALVAHRNDPGAIIVALPADHIIEDSRAFAACVGRACAAAEKGWLTILGVAPRHASSALGYIIPDAEIKGLPFVSRVKRFVEKPDPAIAADLIAAGGLWNAGIVVARAEQVIAMMRIYEPEVLNAVERSLGDKQKGEADVYLSEIEFSAAPNISFDKAVLERHDTVAITALTAIWRDVGTWTELAELYTADVEGNRYKGKVRFSASQNSFAFSPHRLTVAIGLTDLVVVDTPDALLIANRHELGRVREVVEALAAESSPEVSGSVLLADKTEINEAGKTQILCITLGKGETTFGNREPDTWRHWIVLEGVAQLTMGRQVSRYTANEYFRVHPGQSYAITNTGINPVKLVEVRLIDKASG